MNSVSPDDIPIREDGLQIQQAPGFQRRFWRAERIAWAGFAAVIGVALLGLSGDGGLFHLRQLQAGGAEIQAPRVLRVDGPAEATVAFAGPGPHRLELPCGPVEGVEAVPVRLDRTGCAVILAGDRLTLRLTAREAGLARLPVQANGQPVVLTFLVLP